MGHPAQFSPTIVAELRKMLLEQYPDFWARPRLHDPCAGTGIRLAQIAGAEFDYSGTEIEASFIMNDRIRHGDSTYASTYPTGPHVICTSVVYPNGVADHAVSNDESRRNTYRKAIEKIEGADRELAENNQGRYGYRGTLHVPVDLSLAIYARGGRGRRAVYWHLANEIVANWNNAERVYLNVSDFIHHKTKREPVIADWVSLLQIHGWQIEEVRWVDTPRLRDGQNHEIRVDGEVILVAVRV